MSKNYKCLIVFSIMIILFSIGFVSASTANADNLTMLNDDIAVEDANIQSSSSSNVLKILLVEESFCFSILSPIINCITTNIKII